MEILYQSGEIYVLKDNKFRHIISPEVAVKMLGPDWESFLRQYPKKETIQANLGSPITEWPEIVPEENHKTDKLYKMLYVCPCIPYDYGWLDEIQELGFNVIHTYITDKYPWEKALDDILYELESRGMYGCFQLPHAHIENFIAGMAQHDNAILSSVEEPDAKEQGTSKEEQMRIYEMANGCGLKVWGCLDWGDWKNKVNFKAFDTIVTDSYGYNLHDGSVPVPGTLAAQTGNHSLPFWTFAPKIQEKFTMMEEVLPANMPVINIQQGFWGPKHVLPNMQEEWDIYHEKMGLNSFAIYPHGQGQNMNLTCIMQDGRSESYGLQSQAREVMKKLKEKKCQE